MSHSKPSLCLIFNYYCFVVVFLNHYLSLKKYFHWLLASLQPQFTTTTANTWRIYVLADQDLVYMARQQSPEAQYQ